MSAAIKSYRRTNTLIQHILRRDVERNMVFVVTKSRLGEAYRNRLLAYQGVRRRLLLLVFLKFSKHAKDDCGEMGPQKFFRPMYMHNRLRTAGYADDFVITCFGQPMRVYQWRVLAILTGLWVGRSANR
jgi:hypothetical protein